MRVAALLLALPVFTASESKKSGWVADLTGGISCWRNADTDESHGCDTSGGDKGNKAGSGEDSDKTWDKAPPQPPATPPRPSLPPGMSRPKILCLHGGGSSAEGFRMQANSLTQALPGLDFVFLSAPNTGGVWMPDPPSSGGSKGSSTDPNCGTPPRPRFWTASCRSKVPFTASSATHRARRMPYRTCPTHRLRRFSWRLSSPDTCRARTSGSWQGSTLARARVAHVASLAHAPRRDREAARITLGPLGVRAARHKGAPRISYHARTESPALFATQARR